MRKRQTLQFKNLKDISKYFTEVKAQMANKLWKTGVPFSSNHKIQIKTTRHYFNPSYW